MRIMDATPARHVPREQPQNVTLTRWQSSRALQQRELVLTAKERIFSSVNSSVKHSMGDVQCTSATLKGEDEQLPASRKVALSTFIHQTPRLLKHDCRIPSKVLRPATLDEVLAAGAAGPDDADGLARAASLRAVWLAAGGRAEPTDWWAARFGEVGPRSREAPSL
jgi:hypothetical protein